MKLQKLVILFKDQKRIRDRFLGVINVQGLRKIKVVQGRDVEGIVEDGEGELR